MRCRILSDAEVADLLEVVNLNVGDGEGEDGKAQRELRDKIQEVSQSRRAAKFGRF